MMSLTAETPHSNLYLPLPHVRAGRGNPKITGCKAAINAVFYCPSKSKAGLFRFMTVMTGCCRQLSSWPIPVFGISTLHQPVAHSVERIATALYLNTGHKPMLNHTQNPLNISVSDTPKPSITELALIEVSTAIGSIADSNAQFTSGFAGYLDSLNKNLSETTVFELIDLLNKYRADFNSPKKLPSKKTSRFNVLNEAKQLIAERVTFDQAMKYPNAIIKFAGMEVIA